MKTCLGGARPYGEDAEAMSLLYDLKATTESAVGSGAESLATGQDT
jgi:hypothetical protein